MNRQKAEILVWQGCYDGSWRGLITPEAFAHPAKFAPGLIDRIYRHGFEAGWWKKGDLIADPFGGIAGGGIFAGYHGLNWVGVELEENFVALGNANLAMHGPKWMVLDQGASRVTLLQGDSRRFAEVVGRASAVVTSPPYADGVHDGNGIDASKLTGNKAGRNSQAFNEGYGSSAGQIGRLKGGAIAAVVTSPPFGETNTRRLGRASLARALSSPGQIESAPTGSVDAVVTSPPFEDSLSLDRPNAAERRRVARERGITNAEHVSPIEMEKLGLRHEGDYGASEGQIGKEAGETYWQAMHAVYGQCLLAIKPGGVMCVVVKDDVKNKERVALCDQTLRLLNHLGFETVCRIRAMLVKEQRHTCLFGDEHVTKKERKSFFRRLAEKKGSPAIDFEEVIVVRKPERASS